MATLAKPQLFNSPLETGMRILALLVEIAPSRSDLRRLVLLDYLTVHSGDVEGGPPSLHPASPLRAGEVTVRRELVQGALLFYRSRGLIQEHFDREGIRYEADDSAANFLDALEADYVFELRARAAWVVHQFGNETDATLQAFFDKNVGAWSGEFAPIESEEQD